MNWIKKLKSLKEEYLYPVIFLVIILCLWQFSSKFFSIPEYILPSPSQIFSTFKKISPLLIKHGLVTLWEVLSGFTIGAILGFILAIGISSFKLIYRTLYPLIISMQSIPKLALAPLFIIWFGFGFLSKVAITILIVFFPVLVNTITGLMSVQPEMLDLAKSLHASKLQILFKIRIPQSIPYLFASLKISTTFSVIGAIIGEFVGADRGLGYIIMLASVDLDTSRIFAALILLSVIGLLLFKMICILERIILYWNMNEE